MKRLAPARAGLLPLALLCCGAPSSPAETPSFRFDELARVQRVGAFSLAPDGRTIAYGLGTPDLAENRMRSAIWVVPAAGGAPRRLTTGDRRDSDPRFSPDGRRLAFLSNRDGSSQVYLVDVAGGEPVKATSFPTDVNGFRWAPDGRSFLVTADVFPDCPDAPCNAQRLKEREGKKVKARVAERLLFRHWDSWKEGMRTHIWRIPLGGGPAFDLTPGDRDAPPFEVGGSMDFDVSRDGKDFVYASNPDRVEATSTNWDLWTRPLEGSAPARNLTEANKAFDGSPAFSPDGRFLAYRSQKRPGFEADRFELMLLDRASGRTRSLTPAFDFAVEDVEWAPDSRALFFTTHVKGKGALYRVDLAGGAPEEVWSRGTVHQFALSPDGRQIFLTASSLTAPSEIYAVPSRVPRGAGANRPDAVSITRVNADFMAPFGLAVSSRNVKSADGRDLQAWVVNPPGFDSSRKYPAVLLIHGGPQSAWTDSWSYRWNPQVFAGYGYVVYAANPRGSTGFGQEFTDQISGDWGGKVYDDLMRQTDDLASLPHVDRDRIGAAGASYGGYMVAWIAGHTDRFKALVCHDGVIDTASMALETEELWFTTWDFGGWPWKSEAHAKWNPIRFAENFKTPTLVISNEKDYRVPFGQGLQFFTALQVRNVPSRLLTFPDEGHWVLKPGNSRVWHAQVMDWLHRHLGGADPDPEALDAVYSVTR